MSVVIALAVAAVGAASLAPQPDLNPRLPSLSTRGEAYAQKGQTTSHAPYGHLPTSEVSREMERLRSLGPAFTESLIRAEEGSTLRPQKLAPVPRTSP